MRQNRGFVLITTIMMLVVLLSLFGALTILTQVELANVKYSRDTTAGFYGAEGALNKRASEIQTIFQNYNVPAGTAPSATNPCTTGNMGSGDYACAVTTMSADNVDRQVMTHLIPATGFPRSWYIPDGERYQRLWAQEYRYTANATARAGTPQRTEAVLELQFITRLVPLFQFVAFYDKDLEILPGPDMTLNGPVHTNGDLYLNSDAQLTAQGQITTSGRLYRGRKNTNVCNANSVDVFDPIAARALQPSCSNRTNITTSAVTAFNNMIQIGVPRVSVPQPEMLDPVSTSIYWSRADLRLVLVLDAATGLPVPITATDGSGVNVTSGVRVVDVNNNTLWPHTRQLFQCAGSIRRNPAAGDNTLSAAGTSYSFYNNREGQTIRMLDVDMRALFNCLHGTNWFGTGKSLNDSTEGGIVIHATVSGPRSAMQESRYGVRLRNGSRLYSSTSGAPSIRGLTVVSDQGMYVQGDYNSTNRIPSAIMADTFNVLSNYWYNGTSQQFRDSTSSGALSGRGASTTTINSAVLAGTDTTGSVEGAGGQGGAYNGGLENYPRFHENWTNITFTYNGSLVSLNRPRHNDGPWQINGAYYSAPTRVWAYDTSFNDAANLPPLSPRFVYLRQELFVRDFDR